MLKIKGDIAQLYHNVPDDLKLSSGGEKVATLSEDLHQVASKFPACKVEPEDGIE